MTSGRAPTPGPASVPEPAHTGGTAPAGITPGPAPPPGNTTPGPAPPPGNTTPVDTISEPGSAPGHAQRARFGEVFAVGEFRALWLAQLMSVSGDQLARVALTVLVFSRTGSALLASVTFAASVVPAFLGGLTLSGLADRFPRREVMIACDLIRAVLVAGMVVRGTPIAALMVLLFAVTMVSAPFSSARAALYPEILAGDRYVLGTAITLTTYQFAQVLGFAVAGAVVAFFGVRVGLVADAATFLASALLIRCWVRRRPRPVPEADVAASSPAGPLAALRAVFSRPALRTPMLYGWLVAFLDVHEGIAAPIAGVVGGGAVGVGLILAASPLGSSVGALAFSRLVAPGHRPRWLVPLAIGSCAVLMAFGFVSGLLAVLAILAVSGALSCYQLAANAAFVAAVPPAIRGRAFGIVQAGMSLGQGLAMVLAGAAAQHHSAMTVVAVSGGIGAVAAALIGISRGARRLAGPR